MKVAPLIITGNEPLTEFLIPHLATLFFVGLKVLFPSEECFHQLRQFH